MLAIILILGAKPFGTESLLPGVQGSWVCQYLAQLLDTLTKKTTNNDINIGYITIGKIELSALIGYRIVGYAICVHTQPLDMLAVT